MDIGSLVTVLPLAFDRDNLPENTQVKYFIIDGETDGKFSLNETTGELYLMDELERKERSYYNLTIQATSRGRIDPNVDVNEKSLLRVELIVVKDKLFIEFDEQQYFISVQFEDSDKINSNETEKRMYKFENLRNQQSSKFSLDLNAFRKSSIFYAKSHLIKRRIKRIVKFRIEMLQIVRNNQKILTKLPSNLVGHSNHSQIHEILETEFDSHLFIIDEINGKIYINKDLVRQQNYQIGDQFVLTISAWSPSQYSDETENTITQLTVRLTDKDYSFIMPLKNNDLQEIMFKSLNPLSHKYIPRILQADGVKVAVQDLLVDSDRTKYSLVIQVEARQEKKTLDLDLFLKIWKNYSPSRAFMNEFDEGFIDPRPLRNRAEETDIFSIYKPFYSSWLFWLLFLIGCLLVLILIIFVFCLRQNHKQHKKS